MRHDEETIKQYTCCACILCLVDIGVVILFSSMVLAKESLELTNVIKLDY